MPPSIRANLEDVSSTRLLLAAHLLVVTLAARVAGFREKSEPALLLALMAFAVGWSLISLRLPDRILRLAKGPIDLIAADRTDDSEGSEHSKPAC